MRPYEFCKIHKLLESSTFCEPPLSLQEKVFLFRGNVHTTEAAVFLDSHVVRIFLLPLSKTHLRYYGFPRSELDLLEVVVRELGFCLELVLTAYLIPEHPW